MKRLLLIVAAILIVAALAFFQNKRLAALRADTARLLAQTQGDSASDGESPATASSSLGVSEEKVAAVHEAMVEMIVAFREMRSSGRRDGDLNFVEQRKQMLLTAKDFSAENIASLIAALQRDERLAELTADQRIEACFELFLEVAPKAFLDYLEAHRDLPDWQQRFDRCYRAWLQVSPQEAMARFEEKKGNADYETTSTRQSAMLALAASDPDRMLEMAMSPKYAADPDALAHLGGFVDDRLDTLADHLRFMAALRRAEEKRGDSPLLATVRKDYVREMTNQLERWPFEDVRTLVDGEFTPQEKFQVAVGASHQGDLENRGKWADWFLDIDPKTWDTWIADQPNKFKHPVVDLVCNWGREDPVSAASWMEKMPEGELRSATVLGFAWTIADGDPEMAASYLPEIPDSKGRKNLVKKIGRARE
ncbi:hypothetical protein ACFQY0_10365 [Haloferula chungangensis]|uniref:HEAT repeat domain-containing protein n=1 Tax=Haloferula chungangensis TaxID=1048331 RepID=A0ABW2L920_9BACT